MDSSIIGTLITVHTKYHRFSNTDVWIENFLLRDLYICTWRFLISITVIFSVIHPLYFGKADTVSVLISVFRQKKVIKIWWTIPILQSISVETTKSVSKFSFGIDHRSWDSIDPGFVFKIFDWTSIPPRYQIRKFPRNCEFQVVMRCPCQRLSRLLYIWYGTVQYPPAFLHYDQLELPTLHIHAVLCKGH